MSRLKILIWDFHENYLRSLFQCPHDFYLVSKRRSGPWPENVHRVMEEEVKNISPDLLFFQSSQNLLKDQHEILSPEQKLLPKIYLEHGLPPNMTDVRHWVRDSAVHLVHVTPFNDLMWDCGGTPTHVIDHGVLLPRGVQYAGDLPKGLVILDHFGMGGRSMGLDIYHRLRREVPLDLVGINSGDVEGGLAQVSADYLPILASHYRFLFSPTRYASLSLAVCQMMMMGMPVVGLATCEMSTVIRYGISGYVHTNIHKLIQQTKRLIEDPMEAHRLGRGAYRYAHERFNIKRFIREWDELFKLVVAQSTVSNSMAHAEKNV